VGIIAARILTVWGLGDDELHAEIDKVPLPEGRSSIALLGNDGLAARLRVTVTVEDPNDPEDPDDPEDPSGTERVLDQAVVAIGDRLGDAVVSTDGRSLEEVVIDLATEQRLTIGAAESLTCGLIATRLAEPPGGGAVFWGAVVAYGSEVKRRVLEVPDGPVVSAAAAAAMAEGARRILGVDAAVAATGVAGPDPQDGQPVGTVFVASVVDGITAVADASTGGSREVIRRSAASAALDQLRRRLLRRQT
jgi:PncC family amidohydrolase